MAIELWNLKANCVTLNEPCHVRAKDHMSTQICIS